MRAKKIVCVKFMIIAFIAFTVCVFFVQHFCECLIKMCAVSFNWSEWSECANVAIAMLKDIFGPVHNCFLSFCFMSFYFIISF